MGYAFTEHPTVTVIARDVSDTQVLVGDCGGLSAVFGVFESAVMNGVLGIHTEHGTLYVEGSKMLKVLDVA
jgi:hypothetical protein